MTAFESAVAEANAGIEAGSRKGRAWSPDEVQTFWDGVEAAHLGGVKGKAEVAAFIFAAGILPNRSLYSILWQCRKDHTGAI